MTATIMLAKLCKGTEYVILRKADIYHNGNCGKGLVEKIPSVIPRAVDGALFNL